MATEQSKFSKVSKKLLYTISNLLIEEDSEWTDGNPYSSNIFDDRYGQLTNVGKYLGFSNILHEDVEFFAKFIEINEKIIEKISEGEKSLIDSLEIPMSNTFRLDYTVWGNCTYTEYLYFDFDSYDKSWVVDSAEQQRNDGNWDYYQGSQRVPTEYENFEESDYTFDEVYPTPEKQRESLLSKIVIENTEEVVKSLDKETLMNLKNLIESRIRLL
jgi:hypothetical protein